MAMTTLTASATDASAAAHLSRAAPALPGNGDPVVLALDLGTTTGYAKRLPQVRVQGYYNSWPTILREFADRVGEAAPPLRRPPPSPAAITRMEEALQWLRWLEPDDAKLVFMRAEGLQWKPICWRFGVALATAKRRWQYALCLIAWKLNGRFVHAKTSRRALLERARILSR